MKKTLFIYLLFLSFISINAQISQHGFVLNGGFGSVNAEKGKSGERWDEYNYQFGIAAGYRIRLKKPELKSFHYDIDVTAGAKYLKAISYGLSGYDGFSSSRTGSTPDYFASIGGTVNYSFIKNIGVGVGIEPTYFFKKDLPGTYLEGESKERKTNFDIPIIAKIYYDLKWVEIGISGKYGISSVLEKTHLKSGKYREIQMSVFIPF